MSKSTALIPDEERLLWVLSLDGEGGGEALDLSAAQRRDAPIWVHLDRGDPIGRQWLLDESGLDPVVVEALLAEESRPRVSAFGEGLLINLRGVNLNPGADPEDMVSLRMWLERGRIISVRKRRLQAVVKVRRQLAADAGPRSATQVACAVLEEIMDLIGPVVDDASDQIDAIEEDVLNGVRKGLALRLAESRRQTVALRRYFAPQRDATQRLAADTTELFDPACRLRLRETADRMMRMTEDLDAIRDRATVTQEQLVSQASELLNHRMYLLAIVTAVFLPLGLLTGMFGINVGGMPLVESEFGFHIVAAIMTVLTVAELIFFKRIGLL